MPSAPAGTQRWRHSLPRAADNAGADLSPPVQDQQRMERREFVM